MSRALVREVRRQLREAGAAGAVAILLVGMAAALSGVLFAARSWTQDTILDRTRAAVVVAVARSPEAANAVAAAVGGAVPAARGRAVAPGQVRDQLAGWFPDIGPVIRDLDPASFPPLVEIETDAAQEARATTWLSSQPGVALVVTSKQWQDRLERAVRNALLVGSVVAAALLAGCCVVVVLVVRLMVVSHADEIAIMRLIGAREWDIRLPYLLSGASLGTAGALAGTLSALGIVAVLASRLPGLVLPPVLLPALPLSGAVVGTVGAAFGLVSLPGEP